MVKNAIVFWMFIAFCAACQDDRTASSDVTVVRGEPSPDAFVNVGYLGSDGNGCSGVALCGNLVLTAAHCTKHAVAKDAYFTTAAKDVTAWSNFQFAAIDSVLYRGDSKRASHDYALVKLKSNIMKTGFRQKLFCDWERK